VSPTSAYDILSGLTIPPMVKTGVYTSNRGGWRNQDFSTAFWKNACAVGVVRLGSLASSV
jgi:hypothetical protein